ncbi:MAG: chemotaxis protein CheW [Gammaproteobacteria bacterium]|nr:chemotaxis protein CheW [Gammaproteobacteria bacterium]
MSMVATKPRKVDEHRQFLTFRLGDELFSIGIDIVKEIIEYGNVTEVPAMPPQMRGVINLRGQAVPVVDLVAWFGRGASKVTRRTCIVIIELDEGMAAGAAHRFIGMMVDTVNEVLDIPAADIQPPPTFGTTIRADYVKGMGQVQGKFIMILDIARLLLSTDVAIVSGRPAQGSAMDAPQGECPTLTAVLKEMRQGGMSGAESALVRHTAQPK